MSTRMEYAPHHACISCYRGDTTTGLAASGRPELHVVAMFRSMGVPEDDAKEIVTAAARGEVDPPLPPPDEPVIYRLCRDCATKLGTPVAPLSSGPLPHYDERVMFGEDEA
jgi:hypothetical protein